MGSRTALWNRVCEVVSMTVVSMALASVGEAANFKIGFWNMRSGFGSPSLAGHPSTFTFTSNCTDPSAPLNAWGVGVVQRELVAKIKNDPEVVALGVAEAWETVCASPANIRSVLGWRSASEERNGLAVIARYGFAGALQWQQLDTSTADNPADTAWVVRAPVCLDAACTTSVVMFAAHWFAGTVLPEYDVQAQQTVAFMAATMSAGQPYVLTGDLNVWEAPGPLCDQEPQNTALNYLRGAGYTDGWPYLFGSAEGYTGMTNRAGCGVPEGYPWKRLDYAWSKAMLPISMSRFGVALAGDETPSDHYGIITEYPWPSGVPDAIRPTAAITSPAAGATVSGQTTVTVAASDNVGVVKVELLVDSVVAGTLTASPYQFAWNTMLAANGVHVLQARAYDAAGNEGDSPTQSVIVSNSIPPPTGETVLFSDTFGDASLDSSKWTIAVLTGLQDSSIPVVESAGLLRVGPLKQATAGSHYNGVLSARPLDLTGAYASVQLVGAPSSKTAADAMLTLARDGSNHYRIYVEHGVLSFEKKLADAKTVVGHVPYDPGEHAFWRIRHNSTTDQITFETAPGLSGAPGSWCVQAAVSRQLAVNALWVELKAGTSGSESTAPGTVLFDNVRVATTVATTDTIAPAATITSPAPNATIAGATAVAVSASDNVGVARVDLLVDGVSGATDTTAPYQFTWDTTQVGDGAHTLQARAVDAAGNQGVSAVVNVTVSNASPVETILLADAFGGVLDPTRWSIAVMSGLQDSSIPVVASGGLLRIGPLKQTASGSHYNAILALRPVDFTGAYASVQIVTPPLATTTADAMLTLARDGSNHYRIYLEHGVLSFEKKLADAKTVVGHVAFDPAAHAFWRIRHVAATDQITFETAPNSGGTPGAWTIRATVARQFSIGTVYIEVKAGTWTAETAAPGTVDFDNVRVAKP